MMEGSPASFDTLLKSLVEEHNFQLRQIDALKSERDWLREQLHGFDWVPQERHGQPIKPVHGGTDDTAPLLKIVSSATAHNRDLRLGEVTASQCFRHSVTFSANDTEIINLDTPKSVSASDHSGRLRSPEGAPLARSRTSAVVHRQGSLSCSTSELVPAVPHAGPPTPQLKSVWAMDPSVATASVRSIRASEHSKYSGGSWSSRSERRKLGDFIKAEGSRWQWMVVRPSSLTRLTWDILSAILVLYDLVNIPMEAFEAKMTRWTILLDWLTTTFWTVDMLMSALTGYNADGVVMMDPKETVWHYFKTSFPVDCFALTADYLMLILAMHSGFNSFGVLRMNKTVRLVRVLRIIRIARLSKVQHVIGSLFHKIQSESFRMMLSVGLLLLVIVLCNHYIACVWYLIGKQNLGQSERDWVNVHKDEANLPADELDLWYWYFTSLHWSLTQFTPASMEVHAVNQTERIYSVCVLLFALVTFSSFVSSITGAMTRLRQLRQAAWTQNNVLRRYFLQNKISVHLGQGVFEYLTHNHNKDNDKLHEEEVTALKSLPQHLLAKIREEVYMPVITEVPIFDFTAGISAQILFPMCHTAMTTKSITIGEYVFAEGMAAQGIYFIKQGVCRFTHRTRMDVASVSQPDILMTKENTTQNKLLGNSDWCSEPAMWLDWIHSGKLLAEEHSEIVDLNSAKFNAVFNSPYHVFGYDIFMTYAQLFRDRFSKLDQNERTDLCFDQFDSMTLVNATKELLEPSSPSAVNSGDILPPSRGTSGQCGSTPSSAGAAMHPRRLFHQVSSFLDISHPFSPFGWTRGVSRGSNASLAPEAGSSVASVSPCRSNTPVASESPSRPGAPRLTPLAIDE